jgi:hypothetical protein
MSADNVITVLGTRKSSGEGREYRVAEHADSGSPIHQCYDEEKDRWWARCLDAEYLLRIFEGKPVFADENAARNAARTLEDDCFIVEYGVQHADLDETWEELTAQAAALTERRKSCLLHQRMQSSEWVNDDDQIDWWGQNYLDSNLTRWGWQPAEIDAVRDELDKGYFLGECSEFRFADNLRLAREGNVAEMTVYASKRGKGCCSCSDKVLEVLLPDGSVSKVHVGFNYAH